VLNTKINELLSDSNPNIQNSQSINFPQNNSKYINENYEKYSQHLLDQITFLNYKINEYNNEKNRLFLQLENSNKDKIAYIEKLEKEIKGYKNMIDSCVKTCSQLAEEIMILRKEIEKYTKGNTLLISGDKIQKNNSFQDIGSIKKIKK
jgi:hypothetical protein